jgi:hypothetical protein
VYLALLRVRARGYGEMEDSGRGYRGWGDGGGKFSLAEYTCKRITVIKEVALTGAAASAAPAQPAHIEHGSTPEPPLPRVSSRVPAAGPDLSGARMIICGADDEEAGDGNFSASGDGEDEDEDEDEEGCSSGSGASGPAAVPDDGDIDDDDESEEPLQLKDGSTLLLPSVAERKLTCEWRLLAWCAAAPAPPTLLCSERSSLW